MEEVKGKVSEKISLKKPRESVPKLNMLGLPISRPIEVVDSSVLSNRNSYPDIDSDSALNTRRIILQGNLQPGQEFPEVIDQERIEYQVVKLDKEIAFRYCDGASVKGVKKVRGITPIFPPKFREKGILNKLAQASITEERCEFLIVIAMYNENIKQLNDTLYGISSNLKDFQNAGISSNRIACIIIVDGIRPFYATYKKEPKFFSQFFDEEKIKQTFPAANGDILNCKIPDETEDDEFSHVFSQNTIIGEEDDALELQLIFCVKQKNKRKLNTHLWFFGGFCELFQPRYVMLLDVGTKPLESSLFYLYEAMVTDDRIAGCCGEIRPMYSGCWNLTVPAQLVEYKFAHTFDKALESIFGYVSVLPGAFSAYRWKALQGKPLWEDYFKSICHPELMNAYYSNIYLAEDRVLCLALVSKVAEGEPNYLLRYVRSSVAETDVPDTISGLMAQRRRWINGSWFALIDTVSNFQKITRSKHSCCRKCFFSIQLLYYIINVIFSWFIVGSFFLVFAVTAHRIDDSSQTDLFTISNACVFTYLALVISVFVMAMGVKPKRVEDPYKVIACLFGLTMAASIGFMVNFLFKTNYEEKLNWKDWDGFSQGAVLLLVLGTVTMFALNVVMNGAIGPVLKGIIHFLFLTPTYVNVFTIYAICNTHDCTWGNRPDQLSQEEKNRLEEFEEFRTRWVIVWVLMNASYGYCINFLDKNKSYGSNYVYGLACVGGVVIFIRFLGGTLYLIQEKCCWKKLDPYHDPSIDETKDKLNNSDQRICQVEKKPENTIV
ncbi:unnamed protein product [Blepharisma stoltei]|uniref:chitin synthase n=1 Tax=Blepharisma stoltei TaxID=1481888 RepID=A0AAU9K5K8_9CILI|nr:unnamed protein product [Blepharisma stoltei]